jgi:tRNA-2-methylthio-N6-dimethylallyladenosine synthase
VQSPDFKRKIYDSPAVLSGMAGKLYIRTFGCQMNEYDSQKMQDVLRESHGLELTDSPEQADVLLLNT